MSKFSIIPAHDPRVMVEIEIPRPGRRKSIWFRAARLDFQPADLITAYADDYAALGRWLESAQKSDKGADLEGRPTVDGHEFDHPLEWWARKLEMPDADEIAKLTSGERDQVWKIWQDQSEAALGESSASSD